MALASLLHLIAHHPDFSRATEDILLATEYD
jgi:hypothetical protein